MSAENKQPVIVIGNGWAAVGAVGVLALAGEKVHWLTHTAARCHAPLPSLEAGLGVHVWQNLALSLDVDLAEPRTGAFLREYRNKAFRETAWSKAPTPQMRMEVREEMLWPPETRIAGLFEARFDQTIGEIEEEIRSRVEALEHVKKLEGVPVERFEVDEKSHCVTAVLLSSGERIACSRVIYADRWTSLLAIEGLPKPISFARNHEPVGILQVQFTHEPAFEPGIHGGFYTALHKEAGDEFQRHVWGYFSGDGKKSLWSVFLTQNEVENNHEIAKKLRRMKQGLDRMFGNPEVLPAGNPNFMSTVAHEQVLFAEAMIFTRGELAKTPVVLPKHHGMVFITDGFGPSLAMQQVAEALPAEYASLEHTLLQRETPAGAQADSEFHVPRVIDKEGTGEAVPSGDTHLETPTRDPDVEL